MKKTIILSGIALASTLSSHAALVYSEDFDSPFAITSSTTDVSQLGGATPEVTYGEWFSAAADVAIGSDTLNFSRPNNQNRFRGAGVWLDTTGWDLGTVTVTFDITAFTPAIGTGSGAYIQTYTASGVDGSNAVGMDLQLAALPPVLSGTASSGLLGTQTAIAATGEITHSFTYAGEEEIALVIGNLATSTSGDRLAIFSVDNFAVNTVPEPGTYALIAGLFGLSSVMLRRRYKK